MAPRDAQRIFLTGANGFLGANLVRKLLAQGHALHLLTRAASDVARLADVASQVRFHVGDLLDLPGLRPIVQECRPNVVFHLAAQGVAAGDADRSAVFAATATGTLNLLQALDDVHVDRLVHAGSSAEYGWKDGPMREEDRLEPRTPYGSAKACATLLWQAENHRGKSATTVRIFNAYGPWERAPRLIPYLAECFREGRAPELSSGKNQRDWIHVDDVCDVLMRAAFHPQGGGTILHAATGEVHSVRHVVETFQDIANAAIPAKFGVRPDRPDDPLVWAASIEHTAARVDWRPRHDLRSGLEAAWAWFRSQR
jgi:nucleoside-diphosphate-sugar epimerase